MLGIAKTRSIRNSVVTSMGRGKFPLYCNREIIEQKKMSPAASSPEGSEQAVEIKRDAFYEYFMVRQVPGRSYQVLTVVVRASTECKYTCLSLIHI